MTVKELKNVLAKFPDDCIICVEDLAEEVTFASGYCWDESTDITENSIFGGRDPSKAKLLLIE